MRLGLLLIAYGILLPPTLAQASRTVPRERGLDYEPHHSLLFKNDRVAVFRLKLQPHQATLPHRHESFYVFLSTREVKVGNEVRGRAPVVVEHAPGEVHTSKGGFTVAERDDSADPADILMIEPAQRQGAGFDNAAADFVLHNAVSGELFTNSGVRGYSVSMAVGGRIGRHKDSYDRLIIAVTDLYLSETDEAGSQVDLQMKAGDVQWLPKGSAHDTVNVVRLGRDSWSYSSTREGLYKCCEVPEWLKPP